MKVLIIYFFLFISVFFIMPIRVTFIAPFGNGPMAELAIQNKLEFFGGLKIVLYTYSSIKTMMTSSNSYLVFPYTQQVVLFSLIRAFIVTVILIYILKKVKLIK